MTVSECVELLKTLPQEASIIINESGRMLYPDYHDVTWCGKAKILRDEKIEIAVYLN